MPSLLEEQHQQTLLLSEEQINTFLEDGVLVVNNILNEKQVEAAQLGLANTLKTEAGVDTSNLAQSGHGLHQLSSTNGSGGVLDLFY